MATISIADFVNYMKSQALSELTINRYKQEIIDFSSKYTLDMQGINTYFSNESKRNYANKGAIKKFIEFLLMSGDLTEERKGQIARLSIPKQKGRVKVKIKRYITESEFNKLFSKLERSETRLSALLLFYCGLRRHELATLKISSFLWSRKKERPEDYLIAIIPGKGNKERQVYLPEHVTRTLKNYISSLGVSSINEYIFLRNINEDTFIHRISRDLYTAGIVSGITPLSPGKTKLTEGESIHPHLLRHSFASMLIENGVPVEVVKDLLGHNKVDTTMIYVHQSPERLKNFVQDVFKHQ